MGEQKPEKKVVGRTVAISLGIMCIVLTVGLVGAIANYTSMINDKNNTISSLNSQISSLGSQISSLNHSIAEKDSQISDLNGSNNYLQSQINDLYNITNLKNSLIWQNATFRSTYASVTGCVLYAGYMIVWIKMSTSNSTIVTAIWSSSGINFNQTVIIGRSGRTVFPVLPSNVTIIVEHATQFTYVITLYY
jgi:cell division protein FtsL